MCLLTTDRFPKIAWKPIPVYKRLVHISEGYRTPYRMVSVELGSTLRADHFSPIATKCWDPTGNIKRYGIEHAIHAYWDIDVAKGNVFYGETLVEAVIPRFSFYWANLRGDICSNRLKLTKKIIYGKV